MITYCICLSLSDISLSIILSRTIHVVANGRIPFFLWLSNIPLCAHWPHLYPFICWWTFWLLPYLGCCKNNAAMSIGVHVSFWISVFIFLKNVYPGVELMDHMVVLFLVFFKKLHTVFHSGHTNLLYIPTNSVQGFPFLHILANIYLLTFWW